MTRLPVEQVRIGSGRNDLPAYPKLEWCQSPYCSQRAHDRHHIVRRSYLGGDYWWVEIDGTPQKNCAWLCRTCHTEIDRNEKRIQWAFDRWEWVEEEDERAPLDAWSPEVPAAVGNAAGSSSAHSLVSELERAAGTSDHQDVPYGHTCPKCKRRRNHPRKRDSPVTDVFQFRIPRSEVDSFAQLVEDAGADLKDLKFWKFRLVEAALTIAIQDPDWLRIREMFSDSPSPQNPQTLSTEEGIPTPVWKKWDTSDQGGSDVA